MTFILGTDEAGFGPNLGPLVVSVTVWEVPDGCLPGDLFDVLREGVVNSAAAANRKGEGRVAVADSKELYSPGKGLRHLERGVLAGLTLLGRRPTTSWGVWEAVAADAACCRRTIPWYCEHDEPVPCDNISEGVQAGADILAKTLAAVGVSLREIRSRGVFESEFNRLVDRHGSKGALLSHATLGLVADVCRDLQGPVFVVCDKHGGRNSYRHLLEEHFPDWLVEIYGENSQRSVYRFGPQSARREFCFQVKAESFLATAWASMVSKYLRELAMESFNRFWCARVPGLRPTAGYPQDARRFKTEIAEAQAALGIEDQQLWRMR